MKRCAPLALASALLWVGAGCPTPVTPPPPPGPPQVSLTLPLSHVVGTGFSVRVHVSGCAEVQTLELFDGTTPIKPLVPQGDTTEARVEASELSYARGISTPLALRARATCNDGREATSRTQAATFFPVAEVVELPHSEQVVPDLFVAEGSGEATSFVGCVGNATQTTALARVGVSGAVLKESAELPFRCTWSSVLTDRHPTTGKRWLWEPGVGALAFDEQLRIASVHLDAVQALSVTPEGDALLVVDNHPPLVRVHHEGSEVLWRKGEDRELLGAPVVDAAAGHILQAALVWTEEDLPRQAITVLRLEAETGEEVEQTPLVPLRSSGGETEATPPVFFSPDATRLYVPRYLADGTSTLRACDTAATGLCEGEGLLWETPTLPGPVLAVVDMAGGSRLAAVAPQHAWFLEAATGGLLHETPVQPAGTFAFRYALAGAGDSFYLLGGPAADTQSLAAEIIAVDSPEQGEVFRYEAPAGSVAVAVDEGGQPWLRVGSRLVRTLPLGTYREARGD